jgi:endonuclease/exonuclease/phosphatase family metal-dependent hydrolase
VPLVVRTWNLFHGNAYPPERRAFLREMVELIASGGPDVVCLQEIPVWAARRLGDWSAMDVAWAAGARPLLWSAELGRWLTELNHGLLRSAFTGEGIAILTKPGLGGEVRTERVGPKRVLLTRALLDETGADVSCFHVTGGEAAGGQFERVAELAAGERVILAGDANIRGAWIRGYSQPLADSIDQILVRGLPSTAPVRWPDERRRLGGRLLSDHAPVELTVG